MATDNYLFQDLEYQFMTQLIPYLKNNYFIDVGAEKGAFSLLLCNHDMHGAVIEPLPKHYSVLENLLSQYENICLYPFAITNIDTKQPFYVATNGSEELDYFHSLQKAESPGIFKHDSYFDVECRSLHSLATSRLVSTDIGILKIDTEGNDLNVLRGLGMLRPEVVMCEFFNSGIYSGWPEGEPQPIIDYMFSLGYSKFICFKNTGSLTFINTIPVFYSEKSWGNLIFMQDNLHQQISSIITKLIGEHELNLFRQFEQLNSELVAKERVIQQFITDRNVIETALTTNSPPTV